MSLNFSKWRFAFAAALSALCAACTTGNTDDEDPFCEYPDDGVLRISASKSEFVANGADKVTFDVHHGATDVAGQLTLKLFVANEAGQETPLASGVTAFSTTKPGNYRVWAQFYKGGYHYSDTLDIVATPFTPATAYAHKLFAMQFTSVGCTNCPQLSALLKAIEKENPGKLAIAAFHMDYHMEDPMKVEQTEMYRKMLGGFSGIPRLFFNLRRTETEMNSVKTIIDREMQREFANFPPTCGVAIGTEYDAASRALTVEAKVTSNVDNNYRCLVLLVEDGIVSYQLNGGDDYVHNNVVRDVLSEEIKGDDLGSVDANEEAVRTYSYTLPEGWNAENMNVIVTMLTSLDGGSTFVSNNTAKCKLGESVDYQLAE